mmetsp:Transcript_20304/g.49828  ORF Transcript_20304/g.49828 Transcript_20304/m.49828 type:complete len:268 (+) Transcript_20304:896-1699(+)
MGNGGGLSANNSLNSLFDFTGILLTLVTVSPTWIPFSFASPHTRITRRLLAVRPKGTLSTIVVLVSDDSNAAVIDFLWTLPSSVTLFSAGSDPWLGSSAAGSSFGVSFGAASSFGPSSWAATTSGSFFSSFPSAASGGSSLFSFCRPGSSTGASCVGISSTGASSAGASSAGDSPFGGGSSASGAASVSFSTSASAPSPVFSSAGASSLFSTSTLSGSAASTLSGSAGCWEGEGSGSLGVVSSGASVACSPSTSLFLAVRVPSRVPS